MFSLIEKAIFWMEDVFGYEKCFREVVEEVLVDCDRLASAAWCCSCVRCCWRCFWDTICFASSISTCVLHSGLLRPTFFLVSVVFLVFFAVSVGATLVTRNTDRCSSSFSCWWSLLFFFTFFTFFAVVLKGFMRAMVAQMVLTWTGWSRCHSWTVQRSPHGPMTRLSGSWFFPQPYLGRRFWFAGSPHQLHQRQEQTWFVAISCFVHCGCCCCCFFVFFGVDPSCRRLRFLP